MKSYNPACHGLILTDCFTFFSLRSVSYTLLFSNVKISAFILLLFFFSSFSSISNASSYWSLFFLLLLLLILLFHHILLLLIPFTIILRSSAPNSLVSLFPSFPLLFHSQRVLILLVTVPKAEVISRAIIVNVYQTKSLSQVLLVLSPLFNLTSAHYYISTKVTFLSFVLSHLLSTPFFISFHHLLPFLCISPSLTFTCFIPFSICLSWGIHPLFWHQGRRNSAGFLSLCLYCWRLKSPFAPCFHFFFRKHRMLRAVSWHFHSCLVPVYDVIASHFYRVAGMKAGKLNYSVRTEVNRLNSNLTPLPHNVFFIMNRTCRLATTYIEYE